MREQSNLLSLDQKKGSLAKLPCSGCAHAQFGMYLFFVLYVFTVVEGLRAGWGRLGVCLWVKEAEETHR